MPGEVYYISKVRVARPELKTFDLPYFNSGATTYTPTLGGTQHLDANGCVPNGSLAATAGSALYCH